MKKLLLIFLFLVTHLHAMEEGGDIKEKQTKLNKALLKAAFKGKLEIVKTLLAQGVKPDPTENEFWWNDNINIHALSCAAAMGHKEICEVLIAHNANVNQRTFDGSTPLMCAAEGEESDNICADICKLLLDHGAEVNLHNLYGKTAIMYALDNNNSKTFELLKSHGAITNRQALCYQARSNVPQEYSHREQEALSKEFETSSSKSEIPFDFILMLEVGAHQCLNGKSGERALDYTVRNNHLECCQMLLEHNVNPNFPMVTCPTPLLYAAEHKYIQLTQLLIAHGARGYHWALMAAANKNWYNGERCLEMSEVMVEALLHVPNKSQKQSLVVLLGYCKKNLREIYRHRKKLLQPHIHAALYEQNKTNFGKSYAYASVGLITNKYIKAELLLKYYPPHPVQQPVQSAMPAPQPAPEQESSDSDSDSSDVDLEQNDQGNCSIC